mmetsp:Transcript_40050/g.77955  ORF Transcript_40050/g.77955 Transcript_40050/m.77955 type:complete len:94 (+) Transcript_40050:575-856(+)
MLLAQHQLEPGLLRLGFAVPKPTPMKREVSKAAEKASHENARWTLIEDDDDDDDDNGTKPNDSLSRSRMEGRNDGRNDGRKSTDKTLGWEVVT